jgi:hypothetical protein
VPAVLLVLLATLLLNMPFGWLRVKERKYSFLWFLYIHFPIPLIVALRVGLGVPLKFAPVLVAVAVLGQFAGGKLRLMIEEGR